MRIRSTAVRWAAVISLRLAFDMAILSDVSLLWIIEMLELAMVGWYLEARLVSGIGSGNSGMSLR